MFQQHLRHEIDKGINVNEVGIFAHSQPVYKVMEDEAQSVYV